MRRSRQVSNHDNRTLAPRRRSSCSDPVQSHQAVAQSQNQTQDWKGLGKNCDSDDGEESSDPLEVCAWTHVSCHRYTHATQLDSHSSHILERPSKQEVWELMIGDFGKLSELRMSGSCGRRLQGMSWAQAWRAGQTLPRCSSTTNSWKRKGLHAARGMLLAAASCWTQERRYRAGLVESPICPRCEEEDEDMHHRVWRCRANAGEIFDKTQQLVHKATEAKNTLECFWLRGDVPRTWTLQDTKLGFWRQFWERRIDRSLYIHLWRRLGNAQRPADQARGMVCSHYLGRVKLSWANTGVQETAQ